MDLWLKTYMGVDFLALPLFSLPPTSIAEKQSIFFEITCNNELYTIRPRTCIKKVNFTEIAGYSHIVCTYFPLFQNGSCQKILHTIS